jgi:prepilin-type N-terminal cleavage/methylation domain-containing protein
MKKAFTILELLVASLLLGMLVTILTMLFNQSSIAWRTGVAGVNALEDVRENIAEVRDEADNAYIWNNQIHRIVGLWDKNGEFRKRAWSGASGSGAGGESLKADYLSGNGAVNRDDQNPNQFKEMSVGSAKALGSKKTYTVNVKSAGPDREFNTYDDIWSYPDEIN